MQSTQRPPSLQSVSVDADILSSMVAELARHHDRFGATQDSGIDWMSPDSTTRVVRYGSRCSLHSVLNQKPDAIVAEYQLEFMGIIVFSWREHRWPHLRNKASQTPLSQSVSVPQLCLDQLMAYHIKANTAWLERYRQTAKAYAVEIEALRSRLDVGSHMSAQVDKIGVMAESDSIQIR